MSELILTWLNDEVQLSSKIVHFETDFANGFFFGELLSKYNQQLNFVEFRNKDTRDAKIRNYNLLKPTFATLRVRLDPTIVKDVMASKKDVAPHILYQLKMALEKVNNPAEVLVSGKGGKYNTITPLMKINPQIVQYATMDAKFFDERLCAQNRPQKTVNLEKQLAKFEQFKTEQSAIIAREQHAHEEREKAVKEQMRKIELNKLQRNMAFQEDWNEKGLQQWNKNQEVSKQRVTNDRLFEERQQANTESKRIRIRELAKQDTMYDITAFEETLAKKGLNVPLEDDDTTTTKKETKHAASAVATMKRIKEKSQVNEFLRKERDKRRRKMIVDQAKLQRDVEVRKREQLVLQKLEQQSKQEKEIEYEVWRAYQSKGIIVQDRSLREEKYRVKNEITVVNAKYKEEEMLKILRAENARDLESKLTRQNEIEISEKQDHRRSVYLDCGDLVTSLVNLANICYDQLQQDDSPSLEAEFIANQFKLFIKGDSYELLEQKTWTDETAVVPLLSTQSSQQMKEKTFLASRDLEDYLTGTGEWRPLHNFPQPPPSVEPATIAAVDEVIVTPNTAINNFTLGDIVVKLLQETDQSSLSLPNSQDIHNRHLDWLPIKTAILGYQFSGKKTLANCIAIKYGVKLLSVDVLLSELLADYARFVQAQSASSSSGGNSAGISKLSKKQPTLSQRSNAEESGNIQVHDQQQSMMDEQSILLAQKIEGHLYNGGLGELPDEIYVELIMRELRKVHPETTVEKFLENIEQINNNDNFSGESIEATHEKIQTLVADLKLTPTREDNFRRALINEGSSYTAGIVLLDFPSTYAQASLLEKSITSFLAADKREKSHLDLALEEAKKVVKPTERELIQRRPIRPGMDLIFSIAITKQESLRRALGRRFDSTSKQHFHLEDNPPPVDNAPLIERLEQIREYGTSELSIVEKNCQFDSTVSDVKDWYQLFANKETLTGGEEALTDQQEEAFIQVWNSVDGNKKIDEVFYEIDAIIQRVLRQKESMYNEMRQAIAAEQDKKAQEEEAERIRKEDEHKLLFTSKDEIAKDIATINAAAKIEQTALKTLAELWKNTQDEYLRSTHDTFKDAFDLKQSLLMHFHHTQSNFLQLVQNPDGKFVLVRQFQEEYNKFVSENRDMCEEEITKEELHQRVEDLHDALFDIIEAKREVLTEERSHIMKSGWVEREMERFTSLIHRFIQTELSRSFRSQQLISDFYNLLQGYELSEIPEYFKAEIQLNNDNLPAIEGDSNIFPRLEKIIEIALKLHAGEEVIDEKEAAAGKKGGKPAVVAKKDDKKGAAAANTKKGGKAGEAEVEEKKPVASAEDIASKNAILKEKAIFKYRMQVIKDHAIDRLKQMRSQATLMYGKLQDWIDYTFTAENKAVDEMDAIFREYIEAEQKIQHEIQLNYVDVVISHQTLNFLTPPPVILPARETFFADRFSVSQLYCIVEELKNMGNDVGLIESRTLLQYFLRKSNNKLSRCDLPESWRSHTVASYSRLIENLDPTGTGYVSVKDLCTYLCLAGSQIPSDNQLDALISQIIDYSSSGEMAASNYVSQEQLVNARTWFEKTESLTPEENTNEFQRQKYLLELLFFIHKDADEDFVDAHSLAQTLTGAVYERRDRQQQARTYTDLLFM